MTPRRPKVVAHRQDARLERLRVARQPRPGRPASMDPGALPALAIVAAAEHLLELCRLARMAASAEDDPAHRRLVVVAGAIASAIASDVNTGSDAAVGELYLAIVAYQSRTEDPT